LDPGQPGGSPIALPPDDAELVADLTAPTFEVVPNGIKVESKQDVCERLGRSTDKGDAVQLAWSTQGKDYRDALTSLEMGRPGRQLPRAVMGHMNARRR
jgi:hypothetical protein